ncbi:MULTISPECIES: multicopper oxidase family protein [unclassified Streptomyces]|uniref:multicopper oxidase family protein n=1 Tax=unclassified Streptomyces TaxID=2593676 RepID=UPI001BECED9F|nr:MULTISPECIES: multicopper oxidase family protein [unclassified Streptomyces]MBT2403613.1 multicopper oxidase domain-containing protein [Streptomyces sp. ISL-21]MBT2459781.1 multicopper oxidase domain-containing protein [Streptomyces sp. ISL-86]MBT2609849.1 multicopper oxidase domain-containing protein [Streptomyces sp. ISL-87]
MRSLPTRRAVLGASAAIAGSGLLAACSGGGSSMDHGSMKHAGAPAATPGGYVDPAGPEVKAAEAARKATGPLTEVKLTATATTLDLGAGRSVRSWAYGDKLPGQEVRATAGGTLALTLANNLPEATSLHWHGLALRNDMDGTPGVTQRDIAPGGSFAYKFAVPHPGTYWFHPHSGVQLDRGLYAPLIIEDPKEPLSYDKEWVVVLDDWLDGVDGATPDAVLAALRKGMGTDAGTGARPSSGAGAAGGHSGGHGGHGSGPAAGSSGGLSRLLMVGESDILGPEAGDVAYPYYLVNGRTAEDPSVFTARPGDRIRLRIINAGGDTAFRIALGGHEMTVTHTDGFPVEQVKTGALLLGMGERYDVLVTAKDGVFPLTALAEGKGQSALAVLRTGSGTAPTPATRPAELDGRPLMADQLKAAESVALPERAPDRTIPLRLTGNMARYNWAFDNKPYTPDQRYPVKAGERVRLEFNNSTRMWHPLHLHGHTFALGEGPGGARKDTAVILPGGRLTVDFDADNPGLWMLHCHNVYHSESGMMTILGYQL